MARPTLQSNKQRPSETEYDQVALEYYDRERHPTSSNFNFLSRQYIASALSRVDRLVPALELGAGRSTLAPILRRRGELLSNLTLLDASGPMLAHSKRWEQFGARLLVADARNLKLKRAQFNLVVAGLADPYNTKTFWTASARILKQGGQAIVTIPAYEWAIRYRTIEQTRFDRARFIIGNGKAVELPSHILPLQEQISLMEQAGLEVMEFRVLTHRDLKHQPPSAKTSIYRNRDGPLVCGFRLKLRDWPKAMRN
jgi:hypothetical protein